jgi:hypothetical protein
MKKINFFQTLNILKPGARPEEPERHLEGFERLHNPLKWFETLNFVSLLTTSASFINQKNSFSKCLRRTTLALLLLGGLLNANTPSVTIEIPDLSQDKDGNFIAPQGTSFHVSVTISQGDRDTGLEDIKGLDALHITGKSQSSSFTMSNSEIFSNTTNTFTVMPEHLGTFTVGPAIVKKNNDTIQSDVITVKIVEPTATPTKTVPATQAQKNTPSNTNQEPTLFCELETSKKEVFVGEPFELILNVFSNGTILQTGLERPQLQGFWSKEIAQVHGASITRNGIDYNLMQKKYILIAKQPGEKKLDPIKIAYAAEIPRTQRKQTGAFGDDFFADFFGGPRIREHTATSNAVSVIINDLPKHTEPIDGIGTFEKYKASLEKTEIFVNDPVVLKLELTGKGNFDQIAEPKLVLPAGTKFYKSKMNVAEDLTHEYTGSTKTFEFVLQPSASGQITIAPQRFAYFDPNQKIYKTISSEPLTLTIKQREGQKTSSTIQPFQEPPQQEDTSKDLPTEKNHDISFIEEEGNAVQKDIIELPWYLLIILLLTPLFFVGSLSTDTIKSFIPKKLARKHAHQKTLSKFKQDFAALTNNKNTQQLYNFFISFIAYQNGIENSLVTEQW